MLQKDIESPSSRKEIVERFYASDDRQLFSALEISVILDKRIGTLNEWRSRGKGPEFIKLGRTVRYERSEVLRYLSACREKGAKQKNANG